MEDGTIESSVEAVMEGPTDQVGLMSGGMASGGSLNAVGEEIPSCGTAAFVGGTSRSLDVALIPSSLSRFMTKIDAGGTIDKGDLNTTASVSAGAKEVSASDIMSVLR